MPYDKKVANSSGSGILNIGIGTLKRHKKQLEAAASGNQPQQIPSTPAKNRTKKHNALREGYEKL